jgi:SAM-dependent methyltransferase
MTYERFAYLYDQLMEDIPYEKWQSILEEFGNKYQVPGKKILDLACGTGELSCRFSLQGFDVTGVDLSEDMLAVARAKADENGLNIPFYQQNMAELDGFELFDFITIFCDSLNYLPSEQEVQSTFEGVYKHLEVHGLFLFDVHSEFKMEHIFTDQTFTHVDDDICYIWNCFEGEYPLSVEHELTFFVKGKSGGKYDRVEEYHFQRTFPIDDYQKWLEEAGFEILHILGDLESFPPKTDSERILFIAKKKS